MPLQQIGQDENSNPIYSLPHAELTGASLHEPKPHSHGIADIALPTIEYFEVQATETQIIPAQIIGNFSLCKVYWNGVLQRYPNDYQVQPAAVTLLFPRIERATITLEYYPA